SPPRSSRLAWRQGPPGSKQHLALTAPATRTRTQRPRKYLAVHAAELVVEPNFQILRRYRRSLLLRLEHAHRSAVENHVHRPPRLGSRRSLNLRIGITSSSATWAPRSFWPSGEDSGRPATLILAAGYTGCLTSVSSARIMFG